MIGDYQWRQNNIDEENLLLSSLSRIPFKIYIYIEKYHAIKSFEKDLRIFNIDFWFAIFSISSNLGVSRTRLVDTSLLFERENAECSKTCRKREKKTGRKLKIAVLSSLDASFRAHIVYHFTWASFSLPSSLKYGGVIGYYLRITQAKFTRINDYYLF